MEGSLIAANIVTKRTNQPSFGCLGWSHFWPKAPPASARKCRADSFDAAARKIVPIGLCAEASYASISSPVDLLWDVVCRSPANDAAD